jgi:hypothetical protein
MTPAMVGHADGLLRLEGPDLVACLARRAAIEWRLRVVFDRELDHLGGLRPELPSDQGKRHVDAGGHTGRRDDPAVEDETLVDDLGTHGGELSAVSPVRCRAPSLQQAGRGEQPSPRAHRRYPLRGIRDVAQPASGEPDHAAEGPRVSSQAAGYGKARGPPMGTMSAR